MSKSRAKVRYFIFSVPKGYDQFDKKPHTYLKYTPFWDSKNDRLKKYYKLIKIKYIGLTADKFANRYLFIFEKLTNLKSLL